MAFEDRSSPNSDTTQAPNSPNSPESTRTSPYTCTTITQPKMDTERSFFRITSFALSSPKREQESQSEYSSFRSPSPHGSCSSRSSPPMNQEPTIQTLKYSINNILKPEFGKTALSKTRPGTKINFKPYETQQDDNDDDKPFPVAPLGSLCQTVSQIGAMVKTPEPTRPKSPVKLLPNPEEIKKDNVPQMWPAWVYCTRYSDRPSSGPRSRRMKKPSQPKQTPEDKRPRTAFSSAQLARLRHEFNENRYLTERRRQQLSSELGLNEAQIKIWFQNKRAKIKKSTGQKNPLALQLMAQGLYNHSTVSCDEDEMPLSP